MAGQDGAFARNEAITGVVAGQWVWIYDRPIDRDGLRKFHAALKRGRLGRVAASALIGPRATAGPPRRPSRPSRSTPIPSRPTQSKTGRVPAPVTNCAAMAVPLGDCPLPPLADGGSVVTLVVSHAVGDGYTQLNAIVEAVNNTGPGWTYAADTDGFARTLAADARDALRSYGRACRACVDLARDLILFMRRKNPEPGASSTFDEVSRAADLQSECHCPRRTVESPRHIAVAAPKPPSSSPSWPNSPTASAGCVTTAAFS